MATTTTNPRVLAKPLKVKLADGERVLRPKRGPQAHLVAAGETLTVCDIDSAGWTDVEDVTEAREVTCPVCAKRIAAGQRVSSRARRESQKAQAETTAEAEAEAEAAEPEVDPASEEATETTEETPTVGEPRPWPWDEAGSGTG